MQWNMFKLHHYVSIMISEDTWEFLVKWSNINITHLKIGRSSNMHIDILSDLRVQPEVIILSDI